MYIIQKDNESLLWCLEILLGAAIDEVVTKLNIVMTTGLLIEESTLRTVCGCAGSLGSAKTIQSCPIWKHMPYHHSEIYMFSARSNT